MLHQPSCSAASPSSAMERRVRSPSRFIDIWNTSLRSHAWCNEKPCSTQPAVGNMHEHAKCNIQRTACNTNVQTATSDVQLAACSAHWGPQGRDARESTTQSTRCGSAAARSARRADHTIRQRNPHRGCTKPPAQAPTLSRRPARRPRARRAVRRRHRPLWGERHSTGEYCECAAVLSEHRCSNNRPSCEPESPVRHAPPESRADVGYTQLWAQ